MQSATTSSMQKNLAELLIDSSVDRVFAIDTDWRVIAWNNASADQTGITKTAAMNQLIMDLMPQLSKDRETMNAIIQAFNGWKSFLPAQRNTFNRHHHENHFLPLKNNEGTVVGVMNVMHDVSHRIKAEQQLQRLNDELEIKYRQLKRVSNDLSTFTGITGTNLKEPVKMIYTGLEQLARTDGHVLSNNSKAKLRKMQSSLNRINLLLDDILSLSEINTILEKTEEVDLNEVFQSVLEDSKLGAKIKEKGAVIEVNELPAIHGNREMLGFLFFHLLDNAIKFQSPENTPVVRVEADIIEAGNAIKHTTPKKLCRISFIDNGIGFDEEQGQRIFHMFDKLHPDRFRGSGIGLAICEKVMDAHNGFIKAYSKLGEGSRFECYFLRE
ncbi:ATP-binding protein [Terrimonas sp. NA20]|uniref:histidine kinase n=1 Tax=Terrimonas ginsenosidimutans TaxID=2908004 RepID=A0ABS9KWV4_9BACT|nr:ATP-binding protein [Terrimonas ginsenosidimutans]MCG2616800.1 ATP-binding protein [Terrimonas ginsenosidimutans]